MLAVRVYVADQSHFPSTFFSDIFTERGREGGKEMKEEEVPFTFKKKIIERKKNNRSSSRGTQRRCHE